MSHPTDSATARQLLDAAGTGEQSGVRMSESGRRSLLIFSTVLGLCVSLFLLGVVYVFPTGELVPIILVSLGYAAGVLISVTMFNTLRKSSSRGWQRRYITGLSISMSLFFIGVALTFLVTITTPLFWVPFAVLVAVPLVVSALVGGRR